MWLCVMAYRFESVSDYVCVYVRVCARAACVCMCVCVYAKISAGGKVKSFENKFTIYRR